MSKGNLSETATLRQKAEEALQKRRPKPISQLSNSDTLKIIHELEVHQIELEMQNEELLEARVAALTAAEKYKELYDFAPSGYFTLSTMGEILELNLSGAVMIGKERSLLINTRFGIFVTNDTRPTFNLFFENVFNSKGQQTCDVMLSANGGSPVYVHLLAIVSENGQQCFLTAIDVTARRQAELSDLRNHKFTEALLESIPTPVFYKDIEGRYLGCNEAFSRQMGVTSNYLKGKTVLELWPGDQAAIYHHNDLKLIENTQHQSYEFTITDKDGQIRDVIYAKNVFYNELGLPAGIVGTYIDITERKLSEESLKRSEAALSRQNKLLSHLLKNLQIGVFLVEAPSGKPLLVNEAALSILGREDLPDVSEHSVSQFYNAYKSGSREPYPPDEMPILLAMGGKSSHVDNMVVVRSDGTESLLEIFGTPVTDAQGNIWASLVSFIDITERKRAEEALRQSNELISLFMKHSPVYAFIKDVTPVQSRVLMASENFIDMVGIPGSQMTGKSMEDLFPAEFAKKMTADDWLVVSTGQIIKQDENLNGNNFTTIKFPIVQGGKNLLAGYTIDITDRKRAEDALFASRERYRELIELAVDGVLVGSQDGVIIEANSCICAMAGRSKDELIGKHISDSFFAPETLKQVPWQFDRLVTGEIVINERNILRPDGSEITVEMRTKMMPDKTYQSIYRDITERKQAEKALKESEEKFRLLIWDMQVGVLLQGPNAEILLSNNKALELLGISHDQLIGKTSFDSDWKVIHEDGSVFPGPAHPVPMAIATRHSVRDVVMGVYHPEKGKLVWLLVDAEPQFYEDGAVRQVVCTFINITQRKLAEQALQLSEKHYKELADSITDVFFEMDLDLRFTYWNKASENLFGIPDQQAIGKPYREIFTATSQISNAEALYLDVIRTQCFRSFEDVYCFNNEQFIFEIRVYPSMFGIAVFATNITERKAAEAEIIRKNAELSKSNAEKDKYFSTIAHDLRSPFNAFLGFTKMLEEELADLTFEEIQKIASSMRNSANKQFHLLENLLEWSRMQRGLSNFKPGSYKLKDEIAASIELVLDAADMKKIEIRFDIPEDLTVFADALMFESVMRNLVFNAVKFTPKGGEIHIVAKPIPGNSVQISVRDTGIGMNTEIIEKLFFLNEQANRKGTDGEPSTGLGLIICKDYIEKLGGQLWVESEESKGSTFFLTLPS